MLSAHIIEDIAAHPGTNGYAISLRLGVNHGTVHRLLTREFARNGLLEFGPGSEPGTRGAISVWLSPKAHQVLEAVRTLFGASADDWRNDVAMPIDRIGESLAWIGRDAKVFDRADVRRGGLDWIRMVKLDPEPAPLLPQVREAIRDWPLVEAVATGKLRSIVLGATLDRIKFRGGPLASLST